MADVAELEFEVPPWWAVLGDVERERLRQDAKWGEQNHPDGTHDSYTLRAEAERRLADNAAKHGSLTWRHILAEEFYEALAEEDPVKLRAELIQVAAVAAAWVEAIDRRTGECETSEDESGYESACECDTHLKALSE